jgi:16S rRNA (uracil1498-N3)-methyltransferase
MHIVYAPDIHESDYTLNKEESYHIIKVLRQRIDDKLTLIDGKGNFYSAIITYNDPKACTVKIIETYKDIEKEFSLHIAIAPTKNMERLEWFVEKAVEIGIDEIIPMICSHSERKTLRLDRLEKICIAAMKQSVKATLPTLSPPMLFKDILQLKTDGQRFIANCMDMDYKSAPANIHLKTKYIKGNNVIILIGPEGDFTNDEIASAIKAGYESVSLGTSRLRMETAGIVACHTINLINSL